MERGLEFVLPLEVKNKGVSVIEVGPFDEQGRVEEINRFLKTRINRMVRTESYILVHDTNQTGFNTLLSGKPFVDPIIHQARLNSPLIPDLGIDFDFVLQSMLNPGTSDAYGTVGLNQALLSLGKKPKEGDYGFQSMQHFLKAKDISAEQLEAISDLLANDDLNVRTITPRKEFQRGRKIIAPVVTLGLESKVETFDVVNMTDEELLTLNSKRRLAGSLEELHQFRDQYKDPEFLQQRRQHGLDEKATDVEIETWFGLRSEHCFHKEFNAKITLEDKSNDPIFRRAQKRGIFDIEDGKYVLERGLFKTFVQEPTDVIFDKLEKRGKNWIVSKFVDNSGVVYYNEDFMFCIKYETHNSPSNKEPVQGAKTGIDGVERDIFGTLIGTFDAIANFFFYFTGRLDYKGWLPEGVKHPHTILKGITQGVREGGNETQVPTLGGGLATDPRNIGKTQVYCGTVGFSRTRSPDGRSYIEESARIGDKLLVIGQPVGIDGIHGATESSLSASANISLGHVQADFSFIQAKGKEYYLDCARDLLFTAFTDCGAMGIGSATLEMAQATGGLDQDLARHPKKYQGIQDWQVICSETQNRMVCSARPEDVPELKKRGELHEVDVTELGTLTDSGYALLRHGDKAVGLINMENLFNKEPRKEMTATWNGANEKPNPKFKESYSLEESLCAVMEQPDVASKEWFFRQKDSSVKGATIQGPLMGLNQDIDADATLQKPLETEGKDFGAIAYALGFSPKLSDIDPYYSSQRAFMDMVGKIIAIGGKLPDMENPKYDAWAVCGNYCQPNSDSETTLTRESGEHNLASLVREGLGVRHAMEETNIPIISGKDSMKCTGEFDVEDNFKLEEVPADLRKHIILTGKRNKETGKRMIQIDDPDSYLASCAVKIEDYRKCVDSSFKEKGDLIYIIGTTKNELGASQHLSAMGYKEQECPYEGGAAPKTNFEEFSRVNKGVSNAIDQELVASCSYIYDGGLMRAIAKSANAGNKGAEFSPDVIPTQGRFSNIEEIIYSETPGRFIVSVAPENMEEFEKSVKNTPYKMIGKVSDEPTLSAHYPDGTKESISLNKVKASYQKPLRFDLDNVVQTAG